MNTFIENAYKTVIEQYAKSFPKRFSTAGRREWFHTEFPHLIRDAKTFPVLYDMNVNSENSPLVTGMCLPTAWFVQTYMKDVHNTDVEMVGLWDGHVFCHCVIEYNGKFHDSFIPEGTEDFSQMLFAKECSRGSVERLIGFYEVHDARALLEEHVFVPAQEILKNSEIPLTGV